MSSSSPPSSSQPSQAPPLISLPELLDQPRVWRQQVALADTLTPALPHWPYPGQQWIGLGEGSSFNALRLAFYQWQRWLPQVSVRAWRPWELEEALLSTPEVVGDNLLWLPVSQSARTASLLASWQQLQRHLGYTHPNATALPGVFFTNTDAANPPTLCQHTWHLQAGPEQAIAATKTFTGTLVAMWLLAAHQAHRLQLWDAQRLRQTQDDVRRLADRAEPWLYALTQDPLLHTLGTELAGMAIYHPTVVLLSNGPLVWGLAECALKLMETSRQPVIYHHSENFKHGPKAMMSGHPMRDEPPCMVYVVPTKPRHANALFADVHQHFTHLPQGGRVTPPKRLWIGFANSPPLPEAWQQEPYWRLPAAHKTRHGLLLAVLAFQALGYHIATTLGLGAEGLNKAVEE